MWKYCPNRAAVGRYPAINHTAHSLLATQGAFVLYARAKISAAIRVEQLLELIEVLLHSFPSPYPPTE